LYEIKILSSVFSVTELVVLVILIEIEW
jgi:hypothetical protein